MFALITVAFAAGVIVAFVLPRHAAFSRHLALGAALGAAGLLLLLAIAGLIDGESPLPPPLLASFAVMLVYGALLGATGGAVAWLLGRLPLFARLFVTRPGFDPEGEGVERDAIEARRRQRLRTATARVERELAAGRFDEDLWQQATDEVGDMTERQRRRYIELRADRIVHGG